MNASETASFFERLRKGLKEGIAYSRGELNLRTFWGNSVNLLELYLKTTLDLDALATELSNILGAKLNERYGDNRGGVYHECTILGMTLELLRNAGEVAVPERSDWPYYLLLHCDEYAMSMDVLQCMTNHLATLIREHAIETEVDALA